MVLTIVISKDIQMIFIEELINILYVKQLLIIYKYKNRWLLSKV